MIFHSDRASQDFRDVLVDYGITASISRRGNCWDNSRSETLFGSLRVERLPRHRFATRRDTKDETMAWLVWCNKTRLHSTLDYVSSMQVEKTGRLHRPGKSIRELAMWCGFQGRVLILALSWCLSVTYPHNRLTAYVVLLGNGRNCLACCKAITNNVDLTAL